MKKFIQSIFKGKAPSEPGVGPESESARSSQDSTQRSESDGRPGGALEIAAVIADLREFICTTMPDPLSPDEVDPMMHLYDAGYVTSISAADLLAHIESRYGMDVSETQLIGRLHNLDGLARHIVSSESVSSKS